jgi:hypothetical protein
MTKMVESRHPVAVVMAIGKRLRCNPLLFELLPRNKPTAGNLINYDNTVTTTGLLLDQWLYNLLTSLLVHADHYEISDSVLHACCEDILLTNCTGENFKCVQYCSR